jgi:hypothetical protein
MCWNTTVLSAARLIDHAFAPFRAVDSCAPFGVAAHVKAQDRQDCLTYCERLWRGESQRVWIGWHLIACELVRTEKQRVGSES